MASTSSAKPHVAIFAFPFGTHAAPLLLLSRKLAELAPEVTFSFFSTAKSNGSLSSSPLLPNLKMRDVANGVPAGHVLSGNPMEEIELFLSAIPGNFRESLEAVTRVEEKKVSCVLSDSFMWFAGQMAEEMGVPWLSLWTSGACSLSAHFNTDLIRRTIATSKDEEISARLDEALSFVEGFSEFRVRDLPEGIVFGPLHSPINRLLHRMAQETPRASAVLINTVQGLDPIRVLHHLTSSFHNCLPVGPISLLSPAPATAPADSDPRSCLPWLDARAHFPASVAYVSFGSMMTPPPIELAALAEGLEASGAHFLWSLKDNQRQNLPPGFLERTRERGLVVPWAPQSRVLEHAAVGAFVTHCGWNSVLESICGGVPMICRPFFGDQMLNGRLLSHVMGIAVGVEGGALTREAVVDGLDVVLRREEGKKMREKVESLKLLALAAVGETGSSTKNLNTVLEIMTES